MTDYDPNLFSSLAQSYLGGITLPRPDQAGYRVFVNADGTNLQYVDGAAESLPAFGLGEALWHLRVNATGTAVEWVALGSDLVLNQSAVDGGAGSVSDALDAINTALGDYLPLAGGTMSGDIAMGGNDVAGVGLILLDKLQIDRQDTVTISSGSIQYIGSFMSVNNEGAAPNDDLATIVGGVDGARLIIQQAASAQDIRIVSTGNITLPGSASYLQMTGSDQFAEMVYHSTYGGGRWMITSFSPGVQHDGTIYVGGVDVGGGSISSVNLVDGVDVSALYTAASFTDGTKPFTGVVGGVTPTADAHLTTKLYVDTAVSGGVITDHGLLNGLYDDDHPYYPIEWQDAVLDNLNTPPGSPSVGDRYQIDEAPSGVWTGHATEITEWTGSQWIFFPVTNNTIFWHEANARYERGFGFSFESRIDHGRLAGLTDDDHAQYLRTDGTRSLSASWNAGQPITAPSHLVAAGSELTISSGSITVTNQYHTFGPETGTDDDLTTINDPGWPGGTILILRINSSTNNIYVKNTGNIVTSSGGDVHLNTGSEVLVFVKTYGTPNWFLVNTLSNAYAWLSIGTTPATDGEIRTPAGTEWYTRSPDNTENALLLSRSPVSGNIYLGAQTTPSGATQGRTYIRAPTGIYFGISTSDTLILSSTSLIPATTNTLSCGSPSLRWSTVYSVDHQYTGTRVTPWTSANVTSTSFTLSTPASEAVKLSGTVSEAAVYNITAGEDGQHLVLALDSGASYGVTIRDNVGSGTSNIRLKASDVALDFAWQKLCLIYDSDASAWCEV